jgi:hypothetical protein
VILMRCPLSLFILKTHPGRDGFCLTQSVCEWLESAMQQYIVEIASHVQVREYRISNTFPLHTARIYRLSLQYKPFILNYMMILLLLVLFTQPHFATEYSQQHHPPHLRPHRHTHTCAVAL